MPREGSADDIERSSSHRPSALGGWRRLFHRLRPPAPPRLQANWQPNRPSRVAPRADAVDGRRRETPGHRHGVARAGTERAPYTGLMVLWSEQVADPMEHASHMFVLARRR